MTERQEDYRVRQAERGLEVFKDALERMLGTTFWVWEWQRISRGGPPWANYRVHYANADVDDEYDHRGGYLMLDGDLLVQLGSAAGEQDWRQGKATDPLSALRHWEGRVGKRAWCQECDGAGHPGPNGEAYCANCGGEGVLPHELDS